MKHNDLTGLEKVGLTDSSGTSSIARHLGNESVIRPGRSLHYGGFGDRRAPERDDRPGRIIDSP